MPTYTSASGKLVQINEVSTNACPVSLLTGEQHELLLQWADSQRFEGALLYGPDLSRWPVETFDAFAVFSSEEAKVEHAKYQADKK